jgi:hypothetical protein
VPLPRAEVARRAGLALGLGLLCFVAWRLVAYGEQLGSGATTSAFIAEAWPLLSIALLVALLAQLAFATGWHRLLRDGMAMRDADAAGVAHAWRHDVARWSASLGGKYLPGKVFHALLRLAAYHGRAPGALVAPAIVRELLLSIGAACAWVAIHALGDASAPRAIGWLAAAGAIALPLAALPSTWRMLRSTASRVSPRVASWLGSGGDGAVANVALAWAWQLAGYLLLGLALASLARAFATGSAPGLLVCTGALCFAGIAGVAVVFVPVGIGVREAAMAWYLSAWLAPGPAALLAIAARVAMTLAEFLVIAAGLWLLRAEAAVGDGLPDDPPRAGNRQARDDS